VRRMRDFITVLIHPLKSKQAYLRITLLYLSERMFGVLISFIVYTTIARTYGPSLLGTYSYVQSVMYFAVPFLAVGAADIVIRELVRAPRPKAEIMGTAFAVLSACGLIATAVPLCALWLLNGDDKDLVAMAAFTAAGFVPFGLQVIESEFKSEQEAAPIFLARVGSASLGAAAKLALVYFRFPIKYIVLATAIEACILMAALVFFYSRQRSIRSWKFNVAYAATFFRQSLPNMIATVSIMAMFRMNHILLVYLLGYEAVGQYAVAFQTNQLFLVLPQVSFGAIYPRLVYLHAADPPRYQLVMNACYYCFTLLAYAIVAFCFFFSTPLFHIVFGPRYDIASNIFVILAVSNIFSYLETVRGRAIDISNCTHYHIWCAVVGIVIVISSGWLFIPTYGPVGAAWSIVLATFVAAIVTSFFLPAVKGDAWVQVKALFLIPSFRMSDLR
jgi:O-antigen/teichoic acid export membrane protein